MPSSKLEPIKGHAFDPFLPVTQRAARSESIYRLADERRFRTGRVALNDYDYLKPNAKLLSDANGEAGYTRADMEDYDYPGNYTDRAIGEKFAKVRLEAEQALDNAATPPATRQPLPGRPLQARRHPKDAENVEYLVVRCVPRLRRRKLLPAMERGRREAISATTSC